MVYLRDIGEPGLLLAQAWQLTLEDGLFLEARDVFRDHPELRNQAIPVISPQGEPLPFAIAWKRNFSTTLSDEMIKHLPVYVNDFWNYDVASTHLDFEFVERGEVFIFDKVEEYSYTAACLIRQYYPDKYVFFKDPWARYFFRESELLRVIRDDSELYTRYSFLISRSIYSFSSDVLGMADPPDKMLCKWYYSLDLMASIFWMSEIFSYGDLHPDKTFCVIRNPLGMEGLVDMIRYSVYRAEVISDKPGNMIPVIDLSVPDDGNQFTNGDGRNVWTLFFRQITPIPLEEVYQSQNVLFVPDHLHSMNPYIQEQIDFNDETKVFNNWVYYSDTTRQYVEALYRDTIPNPEERILGVVGRGSDYNMSSLEGVLNRPAGPAALLNRVRALVAEHGFQRVFLATEDEIVFQTFMNSELAERICSVNQPRVKYDPSDERFLVDIYKEEKRDGYRDNLRYLGIIHILSKCSALLSSTNCGAYRLALGFNNHRYEFTEIFDKKKAGA